MDERPAKHHLPTRSISGRYLWKRSVMVHWRSITRSNTDRKKYPQTAILMRVRAMWSVYLLGLAIGVVPVTGRAKAAV